MSELILQHSRYQCRLCDDILEPKEGMNMVKCSCGAVGVDILCNESDRMRIQGFKNANFSRQCDTLKIDGQWATLTAD